MKPGKLSPEGFAHHSGKTIIQRKLERGGLLRPRIQLPDLPSPFPEVSDLEVPDDDHEGVLLEEDEEDSPTPPTAQVKIPR